MPIQIDRQGLEVFSPFELLASQVVEGFITGLHKSPFHGFSAEFSEHRLYNTGESVKNIDWKLYGRTDRLYVKQFEEETNLRCQLVMDISSSMFYPYVDGKPAEKNKLYFAVHAAAAIAQLLRRQRDAVGLTTFNDIIRLHTGAHGNMVHQKYIFRQLEALLQPEEQVSGKHTRASESLHHIAENIHKRSLVVIFSDMLDQDPDGREIFPALQHLRHNKHEVILFHIVDKQHEIDFSFDNRPRRFIDLETGEELKIRPHEVRDAYKTRMVGFANELHAKCAQYNIELVEADISLGYHQVLLPFFLKRTKLH